MWSLVARHTFSFLVGVLFVAQTAVASTPRTPPQLNGMQLYRSYCAPCHGATGEGDGPDAPLFAPPPRNLRSDFLERYPTADLVRRVREGTPLTLVLSPPALQSRTEKADALVAHLQRLPQLNWSLIARGRVLYADRCETCHGTFGAPPPTLPPGVHKPPDLSAGAFQESITNAELMALVRHGRKHMPPLTPAVPKRDGAALAEFVRLLSPGYQLYDRLCASCHGDDGRTTLTEAARTPTVAFDQAYFRTHDAAQLRKAMWHLLAEQPPAMPHYHWTLSETQATAIVEYLRSLGPP